jgi:MFS family permease
VPALLVYPFAGVIGDRLDRKKIMVSADYISAVIILALAFISYLGRMDLMLLLLGQVLISLLNGLFEPATRGMLPQLVSKNKLNQANSKIASFRGFSILLGPIIGASLYATFGITVLFLINGLSFLLSGFSEMLIKYKHVQRNSAEGLSGITADLIEGFKFIAANKMIRWFCSFLLLTYTLIQPIFAVALPLFFKNTLEYSDTQYGYLQSFSILGMLLGSISVGLLFGKEIRIVKPLKVGCTLLMGSMLLFALIMFPSMLSVLGNGSIGYFILLASVLLLFSGANMFINVPIQSFIQRGTPNEYLSRVFSIVGMITRGGLPLGALIYGIILEKIEVYWAVLAATFVMMMISQVFLRSVASVDNEV